MIWVEIKMYGFLFQKGHLLASQEGEIFLPVLPNTSLSYSLSESPSLLSCVRTVPPILCAGPPVLTGQYCEWKEAIADLPSGTECRSGGLNGALV